jgi:hypothetical protein
VAWAGQQSVLPQYYPPFVHLPGLGRRLYERLASLRSNVAGVRLFSQYGEDAFLIDLFDDVSAGHVVEAGAFDGKRLSVSWALEAMGWRATLVEASPSRAAMCVRNRPRARVIAAALAGPGSPAEVDLVECLGHDDAGLYSYVESGLVMDLPADVVTNRVTSRVSTTTLAKALDGGSEPEALVLDVEGHELAALEGLWPTRPQVLIVEISSMSSADPLCEQLGKRGYVAIGILGVSMVFVREDRPALIERSRGLLSFSP